MENKNEKEYGLREKYTEHPLQTTNNDRGVEIGVGVPTPKSLIVDIEIQDRGYYFYEISNIFNKHKLTPNRTKKFSPQLIHGTFKKMKIRELEMSKVEKPRIINMEYEY